MNKVKKTILLLSVIILTFTLAGCRQERPENAISERIESQDKPVIRWGVKADTNLFGQYSVEEGEIVGFDIDMASAITDILTDGEGEAEFVEVTSKTRIPLLTNGNIDAIIATMTISAERAQQVDFSKVYFNGGQNLLVHEDSHINGIDDLSGDDTVIAIKGSTSAQNFREIKPEVNVVDLENYSEGFVALQAGQGEALTTDNAILLGMVDTNPDYRLAGENFTVEPYGIAIDKSESDFQQKINAALDEIVTSGLYDEIYTKWFGEYLPNENAGAELVPVNDWVNENVYGEGGEDIISGSASINEALETFRDNASQEEGGGK